MKNIYSKLLVTSFAVAFAAGCAATGEPAKPVEPVQPAAQESPKANPNDGPLAALTADAEKGIPDAQFTLGKVLEAGQGVPRDVEAAGRWYRRAAEQGHAAAQFHLGAMHARGEGVERDYPAAVRWYMKAAEGGYRDALYPVAFAYENGIGVEKNYQEAIRWYEKSADYGVWFAMNRFAQAYTRGELGLKPDPQQAEVWRGRADAAKGQTRPLEIRTINK